MMDKLQIGIRRLNYSSASMLVPATSNYSLRRDMEFKCHPFTLAHFYFYTTIFYKLSNS